MRLSLPKIELDRGPPRRDKILFAVAMVVVLIFFYDMLWSSRLHIMRQRRAELKGVETQVDAMGKLVKATALQVKGLDGASGEEENVDERMKKILEGRIVDPSEEIDTTVDILRHRLMAGRILVQKVDIGTRETKETYDVVPLTIGFTGAFSEVGGYMRAIEGLARPLVVKSFNVEADKGSPGVLNTTIELELYIPKL